MGEALGEARAKAAHQVVVADVQLVEGGADGSDDPWISMSQIEDATVDMTVHEHPLREGVVERHARATPHDHVHAELAIERDLAPGHVATERIERRVATIVTLHDERVRCPGATYNQKGLFTIR